MARDWQPIVDGMTDVQKLVHLAMRMTSYDADRIRGELTRQRRRAYENEITQQAARVGCPGRRGRLTTGPSLTALNDMSRNDSESIVNTYNYDLAVAILAIASQNPRANRNYYVNQLSNWEAKRAGWKADQIAWNTDGTARALAQQDFYYFNGIMGYAELMPDTAVCPICQGWIARVQVPLKVAENNPPPYHMGCPHKWDTRPDLVPRDECPLLWVGE